MSKTYVTVVGRVATDIQLRRTRLGDKVASFRMIATERRRDSDSGDWVDGKSLPLRVSCWRRLADGAVQSLSKGDPVVVNGSISVSEFEVNGERRTTVEMDAYAVGPNLESCTALVRRPNRPVADHHDTESGSEAPGNAAVETGAEADSEPSGEPGRQWPGRQPGDGDVPAGQAA